MGVYGNFFRCTLILSEMLPNLHTTLKFYDILLQT